MDVPPLVRLLRDGTAVMGGGMVYVCTAPVFGEELLVWKEQPMLLRKKDIPGGESSFSRWGIFTGVVRVLTPIHPVFVQPEILLLL